MTGGFGPRFAVEAGFVILVAALAGLADLRPLLIVAVVAGAWLIVSLLEAALWRSETRPPAPVWVEAAEPVEEETPPDAGEEDAEEDDPAPALPPEPEGYPLRADTGLEHSEEADAYTTVLPDEQPEPAVAGEAASAERRE